MLASMLPSTSDPLSAEQVCHVLELLEVRLLAPREALRQLDTLARLGEFSEPQADAIRLLLTQDQADAARMLRASCADDDGLALVRSQMAHEARMSYELG
jgi:hypothetical protein